MSWLLPSQGQVDDALIAMERAARECIVCGFPLAGPTCERCKKVDDARENLSG